MALTDFQREVVLIAMGVAAPRGFAVGGGLGLQLHGFGDRPTDDLDSYTAAFEIEVFDDAVEALRAALGDAGFTTEVIRRLDVFRAMRVTRDGSGESFVIDLGYHGRIAPPVPNDEYGAIEALEDIVIGKVSAMAQRKAPRDYIDFDQIKRDGRWTLRLLAVTAARYNPEIGMDGFVQALKDARRSPAAVLERYGVNKDALADRLETYAEELETDLEHRPLSPDEPWISPPGTASP
jgi:hypothetical protein